MEHGEAGGTGDMPCDGDAGCDTRRGNADGRTTHVDVRGTAWCVAATSMRRDDGEPGARCCLLTRRFWQGDGVDGVYRRGGLDTESRDSSELAHRDRLPRLSETGVAHRLADSDGGADTMHAAMAVRRRDGEIGFEGRRLRQGS